MTHEQLEAIDLLKEKKNYYQNLKKALEKSDKIKQRLAASVIKISKDYSDQDMALKNNEMFAAIKKAMQNILKGPSLAIITKISTKRAAKYNFIDKNSVAFRVIFFNDDSFDTRDIIMVLDRAGKISFYDKPAPSKNLADNRITLKPWSREKSINLCQILELPEDLLHRKPPRLNLKTLNQFFISANRQEIASPNVSDKPDSTMQKAGYK